MMFDDFVATFFTISLVTFLAITIKDIVDRTDTRDDYISRKADRQRKIEILQKVMPNELVRICQSYVEKQYKEPVIIITGNLAIAGGDILYISNDDLMNMNINNINNNTNIINQMIALPA
jgi:hypothetical protein